jgi:glutathione S-transferase
MLKVLGRASSSNVQKVMWCLTELGQPCERVDIGGKFGGNKEESYLRLNPNGVVPTLIDGDDAVWESNTILRYLGNRFPSSLYPSAARPRSDVECWMDWQLGTLNAGITPLYQSIARTPPEQRRAEVTEAHRQVTEKWLRTLELALGERPFMAATTLTLADIALGASVYRWFELPIERAPMPALRDWYERLQQRPAFRDHVMVGL